MRFKFIGIFAALALVAACETAPDESSAASGAGDQSGQSGQASEAGAFRGAGQSLDAPRYEGTQDQLVVEVGDRVHFDYDKYNLTPEARTILEKQAAWLNKYPDTNVSIEGHCDERGTREYNLALGERRANAVKNYLVTMGVSSDRIQLISYGKERPVAMGSSEAAWAQNRRSVTVVKGAGS
ncbi:MAG: peptidoglycan-associated lipoprotein Pal [Rhodospirillales bacterium]